MPRFSHSNGTLALACVSILFSARPLKADTTAPVAGDQVRINRTVTNGFVHPCIDLITFGDAASESRHGFTTEHSESFTGGLDQPARRLLAGGPFFWEGGFVGWTMKVDPEKQNYLTVKLWGSDRGYQKGRLILFAEGYQVGYRHESDHDLLNQLDDDPLAPGRFLYVTVPLPPNLTQGRTSLDLKIIATGPIWFYGSHFEQYQKPFTGPSRGIYRAYTHTSTRFVPAATEQQGTTPPAKARATSGPEVIGETRRTVIDRLTRLLQGDGVAGNQRGRAGELVLLAEAYHTAWTPAYRNPRAIEKIVRTGDAMAIEFTKDSSFIENDWGGAGSMGVAVVRTWPELRGHMNGQVSVNGTRVRRGELWCRMLKHSVEHWRGNRRSFTNQSMIVDYGIYASNRALQHMDARLALPESRAIGFLHESAGITPWLGSDLPAGGSGKPYGTNYHLITRKGLSRELGYVGSYGETIQPFMRDMTMLAGDRKLREQARRMQLARLYFRYPAHDGDGYSCMKLVSEIDNRVAHYPYSGSAYLAPDCRESWWLETAALLPDDPVILGAARQSIEEGQYFHHVSTRLKSDDTLGMMHNVSNWEKVRTLPESPHRLPMSPGQPDFVFSDEENAVLAIKHGETRLFVNFYFRAERAVNRVTRLFELTPDITRIATVRNEVEIIDSGHTYERPYWIDRIRGRGLYPPGQNLRQAWAGEVMPISKRPDDATDPKYGDWGPFVGKAAFYSLRYGDYLIGLNTTEDRTYILKTPAEILEAADLVSRKTLALAGGVHVPPLGTVVLYLGESGQARK